MPAIGADAHDTLVEGRFMAVIFRLAAERCQVVPLCGRGMRGGLIVSERRYDRHTWLAGSRVWTGVQAAARAVVTGMLVYAAQLHGPWVGVEEGAVWQLHPAHLTHFPRLWPTACAASLGCPPRLRSGTLLPSLAQLGGLAARLFVDEAATRTCVGHACDHRRRTLRLVFGPMLRRSCWSVSAPPTAFTHTSAL